MNDEGIRLRVGGVYAGPGAALTKFSAGWSHCVIGSRARKQGRLSVHSFSFGAGGAQGVTEVLAMVERTLPESTPEPVIRVAMLDTSNLLEGSRVVVNSHECRIVAMHEARIAVVQQHPLAAFPLRPVSRPPVQHAEGGSDNQRDKQCLRHVGTGQHRRNTETAETADRA